MKTNGPPFAAIKSERVETRHYATSRVFPAVGRSYVWITCPFCRDEVRAFLWSLAGVGKRCKCGALFSVYGNAYHWRATK